MTSTFLHQAAGKETFILLFPVCVIFYYLIAKVDLSPEAKGRVVIAGTRWDQGYKIFRDMWRLFISGFDKRSSLSINALITVYKLLYLLVLFGVFSFLAGFIWHLFFDKNSLHFW